MAQEDKHWLFAQLLVHALDKLFCCSSLVFAGINFDGLPDLFSSVDLMKRREGYDFNSCLLYESKVDIFVELAECCREEKDLLVPQLHQTFEAAVLEVE